MRLHLAKPHKRECRECLQGIGCGKGQEEEKEDYFFSIAG